MATATALHPRPFVVQNNIVTLELIYALPEDLKELSGYDDNGRKKYRLRVGLIYWLRSELTGEIQQIPYQITEHTDPNSLKEYLEKKMILIAKNTFNN